MKPNHNPHPFWGVLKEMLRIIRIILLVVLDGV